MWVQTWHPQHPLYAALRRHDFEAFAAAQLDERRMAALPPFSHLALLRAEARTAEAARGFLQLAVSSAQPEAAAAGITLYHPVPTPIARVADVERMQLLVESSSRQAMQHFLAQWLPRLHGVRQTLSGEARILRWAVDVDPLAI
jgi:primosomal protein N' (replication factor Y)